MRTRILFLVSAFAFLPACKKPAPPPTPEQVATAEKEINDAVADVVFKMINLEEAKTPGKAMTYKEELDAFRAKLLAIRERNKLVIPMEQSEKFANELTQETLEKERKELKEMKERYEDEDRELEKKGIHMKRSD